MSIIYNIPREVVERNRHIFDTVTDTELSFTVDNIVMKMMFMYDEEEQIEVYYHTCNFTPFFDVFRFYFQRKLAPEDFNRCYGS